MSIQLRWPMFVALLLMATTAACAAEVGVRDEGHFFSPEAIARANEIISQIKRDHGKEIVIETYASIPSDLAQVYTPDRKDEFFQKWVADRSAALGLDGIYVVVFKEPSRVQVGVGSKTRVRAFTESDRDALRDVLVGAFRNRMFDDGLVRSVTLARQTFDRNMGTARSSAGAPAQAPGASPRADSTPAPTPLPQPGATKSVGPSCFMWGLIIVGAIILFSLLRRVFRQPRQTMPGPGYGGPGAQQPGPYGSGGPGSAGGGGGFGRGVLGGLLGGVLGGWAQDRWSHRSGTDAGSMTPHDTSGTGGIFNDPGPTFPADQGHDFSSSGGDFGDSGGGDFGGGGDAGGGDSGSSGGDF